VAAYHDVTRAMERRDQRVNEAAAARMRDERAQEARTLQTIRQAEAAREEKVRLAEAARDAFLARRRERSRLGLGEEWQLFSAAWQAVSAGQKPEDAARDYRRRREEAQSRRAALTDFRLYWETLADALGKRDKVLIDADKVPGRRNLWLVPLEPFGMFLPAAMPGERPRPPRGEREEP
jgi:hypothetical protein